MLGNLLIPRNKKEMAQRLKCSSISETRQSAETFLAFFVIGCVVFVGMIFMASVFYGKELFSDVLVGYYFLNSFIFMISALCISFMIASVAKEEKSLSGLSTVVSLGLCFVGGVFVTIEYMSEGIVRVAKFIPTYWYEVNNNLLGNYAVLKGIQLEQYRNGILVQLAISVVCITVAFLINSKKESHVN
jgi:ABC-2 type transport system permease protein